jgi:hypothetical protein
MSKRTKAATATNGHTRVQTPAKVNLVAIDQGRGLGAIAAQLADLEDLFGLACTARVVAHRVVETGSMTNFTPEQIEASRAEHLFEDVTQKTHDLTDTLQDLILQSEPRTLDETLSLALVLKEQLVIYHCELESADDDAKKDELKRREALLDRARDAIVRGLVHGAGATSPLIAKYLSKDSALAPWDELRRKATELAASYPLFPACAKEASGGQDPEVHP